MRDIDFLIKTMGTMSGQDYSSFNLVLSSEFFLSFQGTMW